MTLDTAGAFSLTAGALQAQADAVDCVHPDYDAKGEAMPDAACPSVASTACLNGPASKSESPNSAYGAAPAVLFESEIARLGLAGFFTQVFLPDESFTALSLAENSIGDEGAEVAKQHLSGCEHVRRLNLARTGITHAGFGHVGTLAEQCAKLEFLVLSGNQLSQPPPPDFFAGLRGAAALRALHLDACGLTVLTLRPLCDVVCAAAPQALRLERLNLSRNSLDAEAFLEASRLVAEGSSLRELQLTSCGAGPKGAELLASAVAKAPAGRLRRLHLDRNGLGLRGCSALVRAWAAEKGPRLDLLDLQDNGVAESGCAELCRLVGKAPAASINFDRGRQVLLSWRKPQGRVVRSTWQGREPVDVRWHD